MKKVLLLILLIMFIPLSACSNNDTIYDEGMILTSGNSTYFSDLKSEMKIIGTDYEMKNFYLSENKEKLFFDINNNLYYINVNEKIKINKIGEYDGKYVLSKDGNILTYLLYNSLYQYNFKTNTKRVIASHVVDFYTTNNGKSFAYIKMVGNSFNLYYKKSAKASAILLQESVQGFCASDDLHVYLALGLEGELNYIELGERKIKLSDKCSQICNIHPKFYLNDFVFFEDGDEYRKLVAFSNGKITRLSDGSAEAYLIYHPYNSKCYFQIGNNLYYFDGQKKHLICGDLVALNSGGFFMDEDISSIAYRTSDKLCITKNSKVYNYDIHDINANLLYSYDDVWYSSDGKYAYYIDKIDDNHDEVVKVRVGSNKSTVLADSAKCSNLKVVGNTVFYSVEYKLYMGEAFIDNGTDINYAKIIEYKNGYLYQKSGDLYLIKGKTSKKIADNIFNYIVIADNLIIIKKDIKDKYEVYYYNKGELNLIGKDIDNCTCLFKNTEEYSYFKYVKSF